MVTPRGVTTQSPPIAISNVLTDLVAWLSVPATIGRTLDTGGPDVLSCELPLGPLGLVLSRLVVRRRLDATFDYRQGRIAALLGQPAGPAAPPRHR